MSNEQVVHCRKSKYDIYIGRPSMWGNPFTIGTDGSREEVIVKYREWITLGDGKGLLQFLGDLEGKVLGCWCAPKACHGDVLVELANLQCCFKIWGGDVCAYCGYTTVEDDENITVIREDKNTLDLIANCPECKLEMALDQQFQ